MQYAALYLEWLRGGSEHSLTPRVTTQQLFEKRTRTVLRA